VHPPLDAQEAPEGDHKNCKYNDNITLDFCTYLRLLHIRIFQAAVQSTIRMN